MNSTHVIRYKYNIDDKHTTAIGKKFRLKIIQRQCRQVTRCPATTLSLMPVASRYIIISVVGQWV